MQTDNQVKPDARTECDSTGSSPARCSANLAEELRDSAAKLYERAKRARQHLVRLAPQYRNKDKYNAEGEYLQDIRLAMGMRRIALTLAQRLESESSPNE